MALIYDIELPEMVMDELQRLIDGCKESDLLQLARRNSDLIRGFQPKPSNAKVIQQRIKGELSKSGELDTSVAEFLAEQSLSRQFICVLSTEALMHCFDELMVTLGTEPFIIGLLFDKRPKVRELAVDYLNTPHDVGNDFPGAKTQISEKLEEYIDIFSFVTDKRTTTSGLGGGSNKKVDTVQDKAKIKQLTAQLEASKCNRKEVNVLNKKLSSLDEIYQQTKNELDKLKQTFRETKAQNSELTVENSDAQQKLAELQRDQAEIVRDKVTEELEQASYAWLKRPLEIEQQRQDITTDKNNDILKQAENILTKQAEQDRHYGNVRILNERLQCLQEKSRSLVQAQQESIKPLPELTTINNTITAEIDKLNNKLNNTMGMQRLERSFVDECISRINTVETAAEIKTTEAMLTLFTNMKLLSDAELNQLYTQYNSRVGLMFEQYKPSAELTDNALWWFYKLLRDNSKVHLLLDGHNILHILSSIFSPFYEDDIPGGAARGQLIERMVKAVANYPNCMVNLFFDGPEPSEYSESVNVKVIYSGGGNSDNRADRVLLNYLQFIVGNTPDEAAVIVTDDRDIQTKAQLLKAKIVSPIQFAGMINK